MRNLLAIWHAHGLDRLLIEAWQRGYLRLLLRALAGLGG
jgi:peptidase E